MSDAAADQGPEPEKKEFVFPSLDQGSAIAFDKKTENLWIGIPLAKTNSNLLLATIFQASAQALLLLEKQEQLKSKIVNPNGHHFRNLLSKVLH